MKIADYHKLQTKLGKMLVLKIKRELRQIINPLLRFTLKKKYY